MNLSLIDFNLFRGVASSPQRRYNLRRRTRDADDDTISQDSYTEQYTSQDQLLDDESNRRRWKQPAGLFAPAKRAWNLVKMCADLLLLGLYTVFGWTFGRFVEHEGQLMTKKQSKKEQLTRRGSARSGTTENVQKETYGIF